MARQQSVSLKYHPQHQITKTLVFMDNHKKEPPNSMVSKASFRKSTLSRIVPSKAPSGPRVVPIHQNIWADVAYK